MISGRKGANVGATLQDGPEMSRVHEGIICSTIHYLQNTNSNTQGYECDRHFRRFYRYFIILPDFYPRIDTAISTACLPRSTSIFMKLTFFKYHKLPTVEDSFSCRKIVLILLVEDSSMDEMFHPWLQDTPNMAWGSFRTYLYFVI